MTITMSDVRSHLDRDEVDYQAAAGMGPEALPYLHELVTGDDPMLASKATYLASLIPGAQQTQIIRTAARAADPVIRVAAASCMANLDESEADAVADALLDDDDLGVRKFAIRSVAQFQSDSMLARLRQAADHDPSELLRDIATREVSE